MSNASSSMDEQHERQKRTEAALRESEERLRLAIQAGQLGIWDWDIERNKVVWSEKVYELHGVKPGGFDGTVEAFAELVHPDDRAAVHTQLQRAMEGGEHYAVEFRVPLADGQVRWLTTRADVVRSADGRPLRMVGATSDVTQRVQLFAAERAAREGAEAARRRLELLAAAGAELTRSLDPAGTLQAIVSTLVPAVVDWCRVDLVDADGELQRALTYHSDPERARYGTELAGRLRAAPGAIGSMSWVVEHGKPHLAHFSPPHDLDQVRDHDLLTFADSIGMRSYYMVPLIARGRTLGAMAAIQAESGRELGPDDCALIAELAQRASLALDNARLYAEAEDALGLARSASRAKDEFLAMLGHELRNPLAPIVNALQLMQVRDPNVHVEERRIIGRQVTHLSRLVDDLLDVSRITKGKVQLKRERVDLEVVVAWALEQTKPALEARTRPVAVDLPGVPLHVDGDAVRLAQILCNLLTNAAKFTPTDGRIAVSLSERDGMAELSVADSGKGLNADLLPRIFDLFVQGDQAPGSHTGGLGLGLAIVRNLAQMHGGEAFVSSEGEGRGATFTVLLPLAGPASVELMSDQPASDAVLPTAVQSARILLVDDNSDAASTLAELLRATGYVVRVADRARAALASLADFTPDLAILDIGLPDMDGFQLARELVGKPGLHSLKLVALTGFGGQADRERALAAEFHEHLVKPVAFDQLLGTVQSLLQSARAQAPSQAPDLPA
ncbi:MAG: ATP-binding protein [Betaproteobacteria bacterium]